jgi:hypothetical protein
MSSAAGRGLTCAAPAIGKQAGDTVTVCLQERLGGPARRG